MREPWVEGALWMSLALCLGISGLASADSPRAEPADHDPSAPSSAAIVERAFSNLYGFSSLQTVEIRARLADGRDFVRSAQVIRRGAADGLNRLLIRFTSPADLRGTSVLLLEREDYGYDSFLYQPIYKRVRRISIAQRHDKVFGTEVAFEDLEAKRYEQWRSKSLGEEVVNGRKAWKIELLPHEIPSGYERIVGWFDQELPIMLKMEFFRKGETFKALELDVTNVEQVGEYFVPMKLTLSSDNGASTTLRLESVELLENLPPELFSLSSFEQGDAQSDLRKGKR